MKYRFAIAFALIMLALITVTVPATAGGPDGVRYQLWIGNTPEPPNKNIEFADCMLGSYGFNNPVHTDHLYILRNGQKYSGYELPYPTDRNHPQTWYVIVDIAETSTLRMWGSAVLNTSIRYGVHGTNSQGAIAFHGPVYGEMLTVTLGPGQYQFGTTASTIAPVPEPSSLLALGSGLTILGGFVLRRKR